MKICKKCNIEKPLSEYHNLKTTKDGKKSRCKICLTEDQKEYALNNRDKILLKNKKYLESEHGQQKRSEYRKEYYIKNKEIENKRSNDWNLNNKEKMRDYVRNYSKEYRKKNPHISAWRGILHKSLNTLGQIKEGHTIELLGYSALDLKQHLESLFTEGMSWDNHGEWHIDHIKPIISFDKETPMNIVNSLTNLQPLWATTREINGIIYRGNLNKNKGAN